MSHYKKIKRDRKFRLLHEGRDWIVYLAEWRDEINSNEDLRAYRLHPNNRAQGNHNLKEKQHDAP
jgi:hypothetical protein